MPRTERTTSSRSLEPHPDARTQPRRTKPSLSARATRCSLRGSRWCWSPRPVTAQGRGVSNRTFVVPCSAQAESMHRRTGDPKTADRRLCAVARLRPHCQYPRSAHDDDRRGSCVAVVHRGSGGARASLRSAGPPVTSRQRWRGGPPRSGRSRHHERGMHPRRAMQRRVSAM
jgi:hypothetical protein